MPRVAKGSLEGVVGARLVLVPGLRRRHPNMGMLEATVAGGGDVAVDDGVVDGGAFARWACLQAADRATPREGQRRSEKVRRGPLKVGEGWRRPKKGEGWVHTWR